MDPDMAATARRVLVIGGAGYIGSNTVLALVEAGFAPVIYDNFSTGHRDACFGVDLVHGDLTDTAALTRALRDHDIAAVVHFAALIEAGASVHDPLAFYRANVGGTLSLLEAMRAADVRKLVYSSTAAVYGDRPDGAPLQETMPTAPTSPYGHSKAMVETIAADMARAHGISTIALRYFNACGADPKGRTGERHDPETHLIPLVIDAARGVRDGIKIFGTDYPTPDGTCIRDYIHVWDLARGHVAALNTLLDTDFQGFEAMNLGTGRGYSVREVIDAVRRISDRDFAVHEEARRPGDPALLIADVSRARTRLNWQAERSDIDTIVRDAFAYATAAATPADH